MLARPPVSMPLLRRTWAPRGCRAKIAWRPRGYAPTEGGGDVRTETVRMDAGGASLDGILAVPDHPVGCVVFAHGSGSSLNSPRNLQVAQTLHEDDLATLMFDMLSAEEVRRDAVDASLRFDIPMLADRLTATVDTALAWPTTKYLPVGLFGASTGAAAALICASQRPQSVGSVVSRGGRPDLAGDAALGAVTSPTLLLVGERDQEVLDLNDDARRRMNCPVELTVVPGATHLFEEPGALEDVSRHAAAWFSRTLRGSATH